MHGRDIIADGTDPVKRLGKLRIPHVYSPFSFRQICEFIVFLPLTFAPVVGTPVFLVLTGYRAGPLQHWRYFKLLGLTKKEREAEVRKRQRKYTWSVCLWALSWMTMILMDAMLRRFGTVHLALQLVPGLSMLFLLTTAAGSAMWAAKLEKKRRLEAEAARHLAVMIVSSPV